MSAGSYGGGNLPAARRACRLSKRLNTRLRFIIELLGSASQRSGFFKKQGTSWILFETIANLFLPQRYGLLGAKSTSVPWCLRDRSNFSHRGTETQRRTPSQLDFPACDRSLLSRDLTIPVVMNRSLSVRNHIPVHSMWHIATSGWISLSVMPLIVRFPRGRPPALTTA